MTVVLKIAKALVSPAAICVWVIAACIGFSVAGSNASRNLTLRQETKYGVGVVAIPVEMKRWDEELFSKVVSREKTDLAEFLKGAEQDPDNTSGDVEKGWRPSAQTVRYIEQFRTFTSVSYLQVITVSVAGKSPSVTFRTINFDKTTNKELTLGDVIDGATDRSKALEAMADYARADLKDQIGEEEETDALSELTKADVGVYGRFTFCPSTKYGKAAGLTIHFPPETTGPYAGSTFRVTIPPTVFSKFLKPGMRAMFSGEPRQAPVSLDDSL